MTQMTMWLNYPRFICGIWVSWQVVKYLKQDDKYLFDYTKEDKALFKEYINDNVIPCDRQYFIDNVDNTYKLIKSYLDTLI